MNHNSLCCQNERFLVLKQVVCIMAVSERARGHLYKFGLVDHFTYRVRSLLKCPYVYCAIGIRV
jgi:hypothetical protein